MRLLRRQFRWLPLAGGAAARVRPGTLL